MRVSWISTLLPAPTAEALAAFPVGPWPLVEHLEMPALPQAIGIAREHAVGQLAEWDLDDLGESVELVVSELLTNAVRAWPGDHPGVPSIRMWLCSDGCRILVQVWDATEAMPVLQDPGPYATHSRGLMIVDALSADWGAYRAAALPGKVCWAIVEKHTQNDAPLALSDIREDA